MGMRITGLSFDIFQVTFTLIFSVCLNLVLLLCGFSLVSAPYRMVLSIFILLPRFLSRYYYCALFVDVILFNQGLLIDDSALLPHQGHYLGNLFYLVFRSAYSGFITCNPRQFSVV